MAFFSIITPIYNVERFLEKCLDSIIMQTFGDIEIILINDGSTDGSGDIARSYAKKDSRIHLIEQANQGQGHARNVGLKIASGEYIIFVDSDDFIELDMCEKLYRELEGGDIEVLVTPFFMAKKNRRKAYSHFTAYLPENSVFNALEGVESLLKIFKHGMFITTISHFVFKTSYLHQKQIFFPEKIFYEDVIFCTDAFLQASKITTREIYGYNYFMSPTSTMRGKMTLEKKLRSTNSYYRLTRILHRQAQTATHPTIRHFLELSSRFALVCMLSALRKVGWRDGLDFSKEDVLAFGFTLSLPKRFNLHFPRCYRPLHPFVAISRRVRHYGPLTLLRRLYATIFLDNRPHL